MNIVISRIFILYELIFADYSENNYFAELIFKDMLNKNNFADFIFPDFVRKEGKSKLYGCTRTQRHMRLSPIQRPPIRSMGLYAGYTIIMISIRVQGSVRR